MKNPKLLPDALEWKFGACADTAVHADGKFEITAWRHKTEPKPNKAKAKEIIEEYEQYLADNPPLTREDKIALLDNAQSIPEIKVAVKKILFDI